MTSTRDSPYDTATATAGDVSTAEDVASAAPNLPRIRRAGLAPPGPSMGRLVGVDLARALAVLGMYIVHIGPPLSATHGVASWIRYLADGHSSDPLATLAGFSLMLIAGPANRRPAWPAGRRRPESRSAP